MPEAFIAKAGPRSPLADAHPFIRLERLPSKGMLRGRENELLDLENACRACEAGQGGVVLVGGEPGIGKTRLAAEGAARAAVNGMRVAWGRCREEGGTPAHWPWVQILRSLAREIGTERLRAAAGNGSAFLAAAVPDIADRLGEPIRRGEQAAGADRYAFFEAIASLFRNLGKDEPLLLVVDDLHAADASSVELLEFLAPELERMRVLLLATYREHEAERAVAGRVISRVGRRAPRLRLSGLAVEDIGALISEAAGKAASERMSLAIHAATDGNPLFVTETVRALVADGRLESGDGGVAIGLPATVQQLLATRLETLSAPALEVLAAGSVIGRTFGVSTLRPVTSKTAKELLACIQEAVDAGIVSLSGGTRRGEATFAHVVYRELFYGRIPAPRRAELHGEVAAVLEQQNAEAHVSAIAFHLLEMGPLGDADRAVEYSMRAGDQAMIHFAFAQAVEHYQDALDVLRPYQRDERSTEALLRLGRARFRAGRGDGAKQAFREAATAARELGDSERLARAALGFAGPWSFPASIARDDVVDLLEDALGELGSESHILRARLQARLVVETHFSSTLEQGRAKAADAVSQARRADDPTALCEALVAKAVYQFGEPKSVRMRLGTLREVARLARQTRNAELALHGRFWMVFTLLQSGDVHAVDREIAAAARIAERLQDHVHLWLVATWRALRAHMEGRLRDAERLIEDALAIGHRAQAMDEVSQFALQSHFNQSFLLRFDQGHGLEPLEPIARQVAEELLHPVVRCALGVILKELVRGDQARDELESLAPDGFAVIRRDAVELNTLGLAGEICADVGDRLQTQVLYSRLSAYAGECLTNGNTFMGAASYHLGRLAVRLGRFRDAENHFESALVTHRRMAARCWIARTQFHYGAMLVERKGNRQRARGRGLLEEAFARARSLGMEKVAAAAERLFAGTRQPAASAQPRWEFRRHGDYWEIEFAGEKLQVKDQKGFRYLHYLLSRPGTPVHVLDLQGLDGTRETTGNSARAPEAGLHVESAESAPLLDAKALTSYRARLREVRDEIAEAERSNDLGRMESLRGEAESLSGELSRALRASGHGQPLHPGVERVRLNVTRAIHSATRRLARLSPALERHLERTLRTGIHCSYDPGPDAKSRWEV